MLPAPGGLSRGADLLDPTDRAGKSSADSDVVEARYVDIVPDGISADDHAVGLASTLGNLAGYVES